MSPSRGGERGRNEKILQRRIILYNKITKFSEIFKHSFSKNSPSKSPLIKRARGL